MFICFCWSEIELTNCQVDILEAILVGVILILNKLFDPSITSPHQLRLTNQQIVQLVSNFLGQIS